MVVHVSGVCLGDGDPPGKSSVGIFHGPGSSYSFNHLSPHRGPTKEIADIMAATAAVRYVHRTVRPKREELVRATDGTHLEHRWRDGWITPRLECHRENWMFRLIVVTDSSYLVECLCKDRRDWQLNTQSVDFKDGKGAPLAYGALFIHLLEEIDLLSQAGVDVQWYLVPREFNKDAEKLAKDALVRRCSSESQVSQRTQRGSVSQHATQIPPQNQTLQDRATQHLTTQVQLPQYQPPQHQLSQRQHTFQQTLQHEALRQQQVQQQPVQQQPLQGQQQPPNQQNLQQLARWRPAPFQQPPFHQTAFQQPLFQQPPGSNSFNRPTPPLQRHPIQQPPYQQQPLPSPPHQQPPTFNPINQPSRPVQLDQRRPELQDEGNGNQLKGMRKRRRQDSLPDTQHEGQPDRGEGDQQ